MPTKEVSFRVTWKRAGGILAKNGNRLLLIEALIVVILLLAVYAVIPLTFSFFAWYHQSAVFLIFPEILAIVLWTFFVTLPLILGFVRLAALCAFEHDASLTDLFYWFSSPRAYFYALGTCGMFCLRMSLFAFAAFTTYAVFSAYLPSHLFYNLLCIALVAGEIFLGLVVWAHFFPSWYRVIRGEDYGIILRPFRLGARFLAASLPRILLGVATLDILLLVDTLPRLAVAYVCCCRDAEEEEPFDLSEAFPNLF